MKLKKRFRLSLLNLLVTGFLFSFPLCQLKAQIYVGGIMLQDDTWSDVSQPYVLVESVVIPDGITLKIMPGVHILCESVTGFKVDGDLIAGGTQADSIYISAIDKPWIGLHFLSAHTLTDAVGNYISGTLLSHVSLQGAVTGIMLQDSSGILIQNCSLRNASYGITMNGAYQNIIRDNRITNTDFGIFMQSSSPVEENLISGNIIRSSRYVGILLNNSNSKHIHNVFSSNHISFCQTGMYLGNYGPSEKGYNIVEKNIFRDNESGVKIFQDSVVFEKNYVFRNSKSGLEMVNTNYSSVTNNVIAENHYWGIIINDGADHNLLRGNNIYKNDGGIYFSSGAEANPGNNVLINNSVHHCHAEGFLLMKPLSGGINYNNIYSNGDTVTFINFTQSPVNCLYNWWGTIDTTSINEQIYDIYDDSSLGIVEYGNFLHSPDLDAPISAPRNVFRTATGSGILVTWMPNPEADLQGYKIYYGSTDGIRFDYVVDAGQDTAYQLMIPYEIDTIAVTAYDIDADGQYDPQEGHESEYAYAIQAPFAGNDLEICASSNPVLLSEASAPVYQSIYWTTNGDGQFEDPRILQASYIPGARDLTEHQVTLTLNIIINEVPYFDRMTLFFKDLPQAFAGSDTVFYTGGSQSLSHATASGFDRLHWFTSGDGTFDNDTIINPAYTPGSADLAAGEVFLFLSATSACGTVTDTVKLTIMEGIRIFGRVHASAEPASGCNIHLYNLSQGYATYIARDQSAADGSFIFAAIPGGDYLIYAIPQPDQSPGFAPTYFYRAIHWENADPVHANNNTYDVDIVLQQEVKGLPPGPGRIKGSCTCGVQSTEHCTDVTILLYDRNGKYLMGWSRISDDNTFEFNMLPFGEYILVAEKPGYQLSVSGKIMLSPDHPLETGILLSVIPFKMSFRLPDEVPPGNQELLVFPNPAHDEMTISVPEGLEILEVRLLSPDSRLILNTKNQISGTLIIVFPGLSSGIYILELLTRHDGVIRKKILVN